MGAGLLGGFERVAGMLGNRLNRRPDVDWVELEFWEESSIRWLTGMGTTKEERGSQRRRDLEEALTATNNAGVRLCFQTRERERRTERMKREGEKGEWK